MAVSKSYFTKNPNPIPEPIQSPVPVASKNTPITPISPISQVTPTPKKKPWKWALVGLASLLLITALILGFFFRDTLTKKVLGAKTADTSAKTITQIGKLVILPQNEKPTVATITQVESLKIRQPFFNNARNGDKLLIYPNKVILYRPEENKIVDMASLNMNQISPTPTTDTTP